MQLHECRPRCVGAVLRSQTHRSPRRPQARRSHTMADATPRGSRGESRSPALLLHSLASPLPGGGAACFPSRITVRTDLRRALASFHIIDINDQLRLALQHRILENARTVRLRDSAQWFTQVHGPIEENGRAEVSGYSTQCATQQSRMHVHEKAHTHERTHTHTYKHSRTHEHLPAHQPLPSPSPHSPLALHVVHRHRHQHHQHPLPLSVSV